MCGTVLQHVVAAGRGATYAATIHDSPAPYILQRAPLCSVYVCICCWQLSGSSGFARAGSDDPQQQPCSARLLFEAWL